MAKVTFYKSGNSFDIPNNSSFIELEYFESNELPFGCHVAACATCVIDVIYGTQNISRKNEAEHDLLNDLDINGDKRRLGCQCVIHGDVTIEPLK
ncbi:2Fe-2S iron-sulfur cluster-binding protein [Candidatus Enterovibrio escicola]|uniref:2Fe-2S iron-sulfur cluster-binding protein n=1 Tax=Candidatus Enterovibrio escicola TaxID=1927127 RepID=UPI001237E056|nr:2Fe-2S iron-sulfur cluster-binding protein [Candidatus Enterovibrio escacola]